MVWLVPPQEGQKLAPRIRVVTADLAQIAVERGNRLIEGHGRDHRRIADGLQFHVTAVFGALQFDHDEIGIAVDPEQIDAAAGIVPFAVFLGDHQCVGRDDGNILAQQPLQVAALMQLHGREGGLGQGLDTIRRKFVNRHVGHNLADILANVADRMAGWQPGSPKERTANNRRVPCRMGVARRNRGCS